MNNILIYEKKRKHKNNKYPDKSKKVIIIKNRSEKSLKSSFCNIIKVYGYRFEINNVIYLFTFTFINNI